MRGAPVVQHDLEGRRLCADSPIGLRSVPFTLKPVSTASGWHVIDRNWSSGLAVSVLIIVMAVVGVGSTVFIAGLFRSSYMRAGAFVCAGIVGAMCLALVIWFATIALRSRRELRYSESTGEFEITWRTAFREGRSRSSEFVATIMPIEARFGHRLPLTWKGFATVVQVEGTFFAIAVARDRDALAQWTAQCPPPVSTHCLLSDTVFECLCLR